MDAMQRPAVSVVVLVDEQFPESLETCLQALHPTLWVHDEVLVVVPAEDVDEVAVTVRTLFPWARHATSPAEATTSAAVDAAVEQARHPIVVLLRSDALVTMDWLTRLVVGLRDPSVAAVAPRSNISEVAEPVTFDDPASTVHELVHQAFRWHWSTVGARSDRQTLDAFCLALRVSAWRSVGRFAPDDRPGTDLVAFCARLVEAGWTLLSADDTVVHRVVPGSAFADPTMRWDFRTASDERQLRRTQELGGAVAFDLSKLRAEYALPALPYPTPLTAATDGATGDTGDGSSAGAAPRISMIVPTFNRPLLLRRALESLADQTLHARGVPVEVVVVNDGGTDIGFVAAEFADRLRLRVVDLEVNRGRAAACNSGLTAARGELVGFLDDDDILFPNHLSTVLDAFDRNPSPRTIAHSYAILTTLSEERGMLVRGVAGDQPLNVEALSVGNTIAGLTVLAPTELLRSEGGFDERLPMFDDWELWLRLTRLGVKVSETYLPTAEMYRHERRVGHKEIRRVHDALLHVYRQHPVAATSPADVSRTTRVGESRTGADAFPLDVSIVLAAPEPDLQAVVRTLKSAGAAMTGGRWELLLVVPQVDRFQPILDQLEGDLRAYSVGALDADEALAFGQMRAGGRHVLLLEAGQLLDTDALLAVLASPSPEACRVGVTELAVV